MSDSLPKKAFNMLRGLEQLKAGRLGQATMTSALSEALMKQAPRSVEDPADDTEGGTPRHPA